MPRRKRIRLACEHCSRDDCDGVLGTPPGWFTPGPWSVGEPGNEACVYGPDDWIVAKAGREQPHWKANARLMADAPRLLAENARLREAHRRLRAELGRMPSNNSNLTAWRNAMVRAIDSALSAAGEEG